GPNLAPRVKGFSGGADRGLAMSAASNKLLIRVLPIGVLLAVAVAAGLRFSPGTFKYRAWPKAPTSAPIRSLVDPGEGIGGRAAPREGWSTPRGPATPAPPATPSTPTTRADRASTPAGTTTGPRPTGPHRSTASTPTRSAERVLPPRLTGPSARSSPAPSRPT